MSFGARVQKHLGQADGLSKYHCCVNTARSRAALESTGEELWGCADRTVSLNTRDVVYFDCLSGRSYLSLGERSVQESIQELVYLKRMKKTKTPANMIAVRSVGRIYRSVSPEK